MNNKSLREQTIKDTKTNLILDAACKIFAEKGFHDTRLEDIATEAGFSKASLYNYYTDKVDLLLNLATREYNNLFLKIKASTNESHPYFTNLVQIIRISLEYFSEHFAFILSAKKFQQLCSSHDPKQLLKANENIVRFFQETHEKMADFNINLISLAQKEGELSSSLSASTISQFIASLIKGTILEWGLRETTGNIEEEVSNMISFIKHGISTMPGESSPFKKGPSASDDKQE